MEKEISELEKDLRDKFTKLRTLRYQPALFIIEHFFEIQTCIDIDAETALSNLQQAGDNEQQDASKKFKSEEDEPINRTRLEWIDLLNNIQRTIMSRLNAEPRAEPDEAFDPIKQMIDQFHTPVPGQDLDLDAKKAEYARIVLEIFNETIKLEKELLGNSTIFYKPSTDQSRLGTLFYIPKGYLSSGELNYLK